MSFKMQFIPKSSNTKYSSSFIFILPKYPQFDIINIDITFFFFFFLSGNENMWARCVYVIQL